MAPPTRACHACATPLTGGTRYCGVCGTATSGGLPGFPGDPEADPADAMERVRRGLAGRYAIERVVGSGGTATVYLAEDLRHRRQVAVKVLRPEIATLVGSARFLREIEIAARLQHPRILPVYDSGESAPDGADGARVLFYVMPFAAESLASRLERGPVPLADAVRILSQLADALAFAHAHGVVHRDIKPDNVMLAGRHAMIADFGIAKALAVPLGHRTPTRPGVPMGTPYYMAPEQVAGDPEIDGRADQYALGVVGYELLARRRPFSGATVQEILAAQVLESPEPLDTVRPEVPPALARVVMRCLEKDPGRRWERTEDLAEQLEAMALGSATPPEELPAIAPRVAGARGLWRVAAGGALVSALAAALLLGRGSAPPPAVPMSDQVSFSGAIGMATISPDGRFLAYSSRDEGTLLIQELAGGPPLVIARGLTRVLALRWSPDGTRLLAGGWYEGEPGIYLLSRLGGPLRRVSPGRLAQWHPDGSRLSLWDYPDKAVRLVDLATGDSLTFRLPGSYDWLYDAEWSPGGDRLAYVTMSEPDRYTLRTVGRDGTSRILLQDSLPLGSPRWSPGQDALYYLREATELKVVRLGRSGAPRGESVTLVDGLQAGPSEVAGVTVPFTVTADGRRMVYLRSLDYANLWLLTRGPAPGDSFSARRLTTGTALRRGVAVSPDRKWIAYLETSKDGTDLFRMPIGGGPGQRLTFSARVASRQAAWSPDGTRLALGVHEAGVVRLATVGAAGGEARTLPGTSLPAMGDVAWAPGGWIMHQVSGNRNFRLIDPEGGASRRLVPQDGTGWIFAPQPSPDGGKVAVFWNRRPHGGGLWVVSLRDTTPVVLAEGRLSPVGWSADGRSVLAIGADGGGLMRLGLDGRTDTVGVLPFRNPDCVAAAAEALVCAVPERVSDVWMVTGFDPGR